MCNILETFKPSPFTHLLLLMLHSLSTSHLQKDKSFLFKSFVHLESISTAVPMFSEGWIFWKPVQYRYLSDFSESLLIDRLFQSFLKRANLITRFTLYLAVHCNTLTRLHFICSYRYVSFRTSVSWATLPS